MKKWVKQDMSLVVDTVYFFFFFFISSLLFLITNHFMSGEDKNRKLGGMGLS